MLQPDSYFTSNTPFQTVLFDITGHCNAKCPWCVTYNDRHIKAARGYTTPDTFRRVLDRLLEIGAITNNTQFSLHNWGEPVLNKHLPEFTRILTEYKLHWGFSTNCSILPDFDGMDFDFLSSVALSMPGFSQESYDKIHGFNFHTVKNNMSEYGKVLQEIKRDNSANSYACIKYHIYQFNVEEIPLAQEFAKNNGLEFDTSCAYINNSQKALSYLKGTLPVQDLYDASKSLFLHYVDDLIAQKPSDYVCPQYSSLSLDEFGRVLTCCGPARTQESYSVGLIFDLTLPEIHKKRRKQAFCKECLGSGLVYWVHNPHRPKFGAKYLTEKDLFDELLRRGMISVE